MLEIIIISGLVCATILLALKKMKVLDWYGAHFGHIAWLPASDCFLCLGFWLSGFVWFPLAIISCFFTTWMDAVLILLIPFGSTAISTYLTHEIIRD